MARNKIGFHLGSGGNKTGWGNYVSILDNLNIPSVCMSVGGEGFGDIKSKWDNGSNVNHVAVVRYMPHNGQDVPNYNTTPEQAVQQWLDWYAPKIGNDVKQYHQRVITKHGNELDKNRISWLARFYTLLHPALLQRMGWQSHRICCFSFSTGEPELEHWEEPDVLNFLRLAGDNPDKWVIGLHEYSLANDLQSGYPHMIGRFKQLFDVCDRHGIKRPHIVIHEFGWRQESVPPVDNAIQQIDELTAPLYAYYPEILGVGIWTTQNWPGGCIPNCVQALIAPITDLTVNREYEEGSNMCNCTAIQDIKTTSIWIPQYERMTEGEKTQVFLWAQTGFPLPNGTNTNGNHMLCPSHIDALRIHTAGLSGSILAIAYPHKIGTGVTLEWIQQNCPCALENGRQVVFLGQQNSGFTFDSPPIVTR